MNVKKYVGFAAAAALLLSCLSGCGGQTPAAAATTEPVNYSAGVTVWYAGLGKTLGSNLTTLIRQFNTGDGAASGVSVKLRAFDSETQLVDALTSGGSIPSLVICGRDAAAAIAGSDVSLCTDKYCPEESLSGLTEGYVQAAKTGGTLSGVPLAASADVLMVNSALVSKLKNYTDAELATPEGVCAAASEYSASAKSAFFTAQSFTGLFRAGLAQYGDDFHAQKDEDIKNDHYVYLYNLLAEAAYKGGVTASDSDAAGLVAAGKLPCAVVSSCSAADSGAKAGDVRILPYPIVKGGLKVYSENLTEALITAGAENERQASAFLIRWLLASGAALTKDSGYFPAQAELNAAAMSGSDTDSALVKAVDAAVSAQAQESKLSFPATDADYLASSVEFENNFRETLRGLS
jgi:ABC-type glycerol-3-phosphate transport system substrate-binding protein